MAKQTVSRKALGAAICRTIEQYQPEKIRLFDDPVAKELVGGPIKFLMQFAGMRNLTVHQTDVVAKGIYGVQVCRTRFIDDVVQMAISQGIEQLVILGSGYDTRPYRLPQIKNVKVFEVDLPTVQEDKKKKLQKHLGRLPEHVTFVPTGLLQIFVRIALANTRSLAATPGDGSLVRSSSSVAPTLSSQPAAVLPHHQAIGQNMQKSRDNRSQSGDDADCTSLR